MVLKQQRGFFTLGSNSALMTVLLVIIAVLLIPSMITKCQNTEVIAANKVQQVTIATQAGVIKDKDTQLDMKDNLNQSERNSTYTLNKQAGGILNTVDVVMDKLDAAQQKKEAAQTKAKAPTTAQVSGKTADKTQPSTQEASQEDPSDRELAQTQIDAVWDLYNQVQQKKAS